MLRSAEIRRRRLRGLTSAATLTGALTAATTLAVRGSAQTPTFSTKTEAIHVTATVIDQDGRLATGLSKDDFEIRENGVPREITIFRSDTVPFAIAIMLDVSGSMVLNLGLMRRGMEQLISRFEPGDRATVGTFQGLPMINPRFTANPQRLMEGVAGAMGGMGAPCTGQWHPESVAGSVGGSAVWAAIECGIEQVAADSETPRRVVMVVTDAMDNASKRVGPSDLKKLADDYGIMIYGVGMRGSEGLNSPTLRELAEKSGGGYFQLKDFSELRSGASPTSCGISTSSASRRHLPTIASARSKCDRCGPARPRAGGASICRLPRSTPGQPPASPRQRQPRPNPGR
jgi:Ca-activated chloride channel family protein